MFESISRSFKLVGESFRVLSKDKELLLFPIVSGFASILLFISFIVPVVLAYINPATRESANAITYALFFVYYLINYFIVIFFNAGLVTCAHMRLSGKDPSFMDGIRGASKHFINILIWALIAATVGIILRSISRRSGMIGKIITGLLGMAWSLLTFFVVPVIVIENLSPFTSIKRSGELIKNTWGENIAGGLSLGGFFIVLALLGFVPLIFAVLTGSIAFIVIMVAALLLYWICLAILSSALSGIFTTALFIYAKTGKMPSAYDPELVPKRKAK